MSDFERRTYETELRLARADDDNGAPRLRGYAAVFDAWSQDLGGFRERIDRHAFDRTLADGPDVAALLNHDPNYVLGRKSAGTLRLWTDERGLAVEITPPDAQWARDLLASIGRGDIYQMSFSFRVRRDEWNEEAEPVERTLLDVELIDVAPVTFPAYEQTEIGLRELLRRAQTRAQNAPAGQGSGGQAPQGRPAALAQAQIELAKRK